MTDRTHRRKRAWISNHCDYITAAQQNILTRMRHQVFQSNRSDNIATCQLYVRILNIRSRTAHGSHRIQHTLACSRQRHTHTVTRADNRYIRRIVLNHAHHYLRLVRHFFQTAFNNVLHLNRCFTKDRHIADKRHRNRT